MITRVKTAGKNQTPHYLFNKDDANEDATSEELINNAAKIFEGYFSKDNHAEWKKVLAYVVKTFEDNKLSSNKTSDPIFYRPSWYDFE